ncbi:carboxypeptidase-like regulatory domain-containing protein [Bacteroidota bacterium]
MLIIVSINIAVFQLVFTQPTQTIRGKVVDQESQMPLLAANVMILEVGPLTGVITDESGIFNIEDVPVGRYNILVSHLGYESFIMRDVVLGTGKEVILNVGMKESILELEGVSVAANISKDQTINPMAGISARSFTVEETEKYAGSWGDPARMASNYAGVFPNGDIYNYIVIRGNSPYGLIWRMEGIPIPNPNHFNIPGATGGPISMVNNKQLSQSDFLTSAFPAEYGNGVSGVFDLQMRNGNNKKHEHVAELGLMGIELGAEGPFSKKSGASYMVNLRYSLLGLVNELLWVEALPQYQDLSFKLNFPTKKGKISVFGFGGTSRIRGVIDDSASTTPMYHKQLSDESGAKTGVVGFKHTHFLGSHTRIISDISFSTTRSYDRNDSVVNDVTTRNLAMNRYTEDRLLISSRLLTKLNAKNSMNFGIYLENNFVKYNFHDESILYPGSFGDSLVIYPPKFTEDNKLLVFRSHVEWKHRFTNSLTLYTGLTYNHFFMNNSKALEPRANLRWNFTDKQALSIGYGLHSQLHPFFHYLQKTYLSDDLWDRQDYIETNRELGFSKSQHLALGYDYSISQNLRLKAEVYQQRLYDIPVERKPSSFSLINIGAGTEDPLIDSLVNEGTGRNMGIDLTVEKFFNERYYFLVTASLLDSKYKGSDGILRNTAFNSNLNINALLGYEFPIRENGSIDINIRFVSAGGRRIVPLDVEKTLQEDDEVYIYELAYETRLANYFRLDWRLGYKYNGPKVRHEIGMDIANITNRPNEWEQRYDSHSKQIKMIYQQGTFFYVFYRINF